MKKNSLTFVMIYMGAVCLIILTGIFVCLSLPNDEARAMYSENSKVYNITNITESEVPLDDVIDD